MAWRRSSPVASAGGQVALSGPNAQTVAQFDITSQEGEAITATIYVGCNPALTTNPSSPPIDNILWTIQWGYGGAIFSETFIGNSGRWVKSGDRFRVNAQLVNSNGGPPTSGDTTTVRAMVVPTADPQNRAPTIFVEQNVNAAGFLVQLPNAIRGPNPQSLPPLTLLRLWGYNGGTTSVYVALYDARNPLGGGEAVSFPVAFVPAQATFSLDLYPTGLPFSNGVVLAPSTAPTTYVAPASASIVTGFELYPQPAF